MSISPWLQEDEKQVNPWLQDAPQQTNPWLQDTPQQVNPSNPWLEMGTQEKSPEDVKQGFSLEDYAGKQFVNVPMGAPIGQAMDAVYKYGTGAVMSLFDLLQRGQYASANAVNELLARTGIGGYGSYPKEWQKPIGTAILEGLSGKTKGSYLDVAGKLFQPQLEAWQKTWEERTQNWPGWLRAAWLKAPEFIMVRGLGLTGDIALDPGNYLGLGAPVKGGRALLSFAGKSITPQKINKVVFDNLADWANAFRKSKAGQLLTRYLSAKGPISDQELWQLSREYEALAEHMRNEAIKNNIPFEQAMQDIEKNLGISREAMMELLEKKYEIRQPSLGAAGLTIDEGVPGGEVVGKGRWVKKADPNALANLEALKKALGETEEQLAEKVIYHVDEMLREIKQGTPGFRFSTYEGEWGGQPSTYPDWIKEQHLDTKRAKQALEKIRKDPLKVLLGESYTYIRNGVEHEDDIANYIAGTIKERLTKGYGSERFLMRVPPDEEVQGLLDFRETLRQQMEEPIPKRPTLVFGEGNDIVQPRLVGSASEVPVGPPSTWTYVVKPGDTLSEIAKANNTTVEELAKLNKIDNPDLIRVGQEIRIPARVEGMEQILGHVERPLIETLPEDVVKLRNRIRKHQDEILQAEIKAGIDISPLDDELVAYMGHYRTKEAREAMKKAGLTWEQVIKQASQHPSTRARNIRGLTAQEINELARTGELIPGFKGELLQVDPIAVQTVRDMYSASARAGAQFIDEVKANPQWAVPAGDTMPVGFKPPTDEMKKRFGSKVEGYLFSDEAREALTKYAKAMDPEKLDPIIKAIDTFYRFWKPYTLATPKWIANNIIGNLWNGLWLGDMNPASLVRGLRAMVGSSKKLKGTNLTYKEVLEQAKRLGVYDSGLFATATEKTLREKLVGGDWVSQLTKPAQPIMSANRAIENHMRLSMFVDRLSKGYSPKAAANDVKKFLFDYTELSDWEKNVARRWLPFYTWPRKNIPLQIEMFATKPGKFGLLPKLQGAIEYGQELQDKETLPEWLQETQPWQVGRTRTGNVIQWPTTYSIPAMDILSLGKGPIRSVSDVGRSVVNVIGSLGKEVAGGGPLAQALMIGAFGFDPFTERVIGPDDTIKLFGQWEIPEREARLLMALAPPLRHAQSMLQPSGLFEEVYGTAPELVGRLIKTFFTNFYIRNEATDLQQWGQRVEKKVRQLKRDPYEMLWEDVSLLENPDKWLEAIEENLDKGIDEILEMLD